MGLSSLAQQVNIMRKQWKSVCSYCRLALRLSMGVCLSIGGTGAMRTEDSIALAKAAKSSWYRCATGCHTALFRANRQRECPSCACR